MSFNDALVVCFVISGQHMYIYIYICDIQHACRSVAQKYGKHAQHVDIESTIKHVLDVDMQGTEASNLT